MATLPELVAFFGWCSVLNIGLLSFSAIFLIVFKGFTSKLHSQMFAVPADELPRLYFTFLAQYKIAVIIFNLVPYVALKLMS